MATNLRKLAILFASSIAALSGCSGLAGSPPLAPGSTQTESAPHQNAPPPAKTADWDNLGFDTNQSGYNNLEKTLGTGNVGSLTELWQSAGIQMDQMVESNAVLYTTMWSPSTGTALQAYDEKTGSLLWTTGVPNQPGGGGTLAVGSGLLFTYAGSGTVCAFKTKNGKTAWCQSFPSSKYRLGNPEGLTYANGIVYVPLLGGPYVADALVALNASNGGQVWATTTDVGGCCSLGNTTRPIVSHGRVYDECNVLVGSGSKAFTDWGICAYDAATGSEQWMYVPVSKSNFAYYLAADKKGNLYLSLLYAPPGSGPNALVQKLTSSGSMVWSRSYTLCHSDQGEFELANDNKNVYAQLDADAGSCGSQQDSILYTFSAKNGQQLWQASPGQGNSFLDAPVVANGVVYSQTRGGMMALALSNGTTLWNPGGGASSQCYGGCSAPPIVVNGLVHAPCGGFGNTHLCTFGLPSEKKRGK